MRTILIVVHPGSACGSADFNLGEAEAALALSAALEERGFLVVAIRPPTVPAGTGRLRVAFSAAHTEAQVDGLAEAVMRQWPRTLPPFRERVR